MQVVWTNYALQDLDRLHEFLASANAIAAAHVIQSLVAAPVNLLTHSRIGSVLERYEPREVRRLIVGSYEMHYEINASSLSILRVWHTRENR
ncbi:type II toxin-antitoxin system RelE/ParE family toxin [Serratia liquefaciens]|uniref:type II toxin-antitoxin system RelE/ParE family toxin n=1 Tax=Serratia liquefaciens TaxID=614 RepID=UPI000900608C|nr:type II toxin-antitoxin system RelE/ParE family toxin [Serratia liquefaciens]AUW40029.1 type II toxin-antitoxin system RelE/ParE family toxin [Serratia liquefaciens]